MGPTGGGAFRATATSHPRARDSAEDFASPERSIAGWPVCARCAECRRGSDRSRGRPSPRPPPPGLRCSFSRPDSVSPSAKHYEATEHAEDQPVRLHIEVFAEQDVEERADAGRSCLLCRRDTIASSFSRKTTLPSIGRSNLWWKEQHTRSSVMFSWTHIGFSGIVVSQAVNCAAARFRDRHHHSSVLFTVKRAATPNQPTSATRVKTQRCEVDAEPVGAGHAAQPRFRRL